MTWRKDLIMGICWSKSDDSDWKILDTPILFYR